LGEAAFAGRLFALSVFCFECAGVFSADFLFGPSFTMLSGEDELPLQCEATDEAWHYHLDRATFRR
jgi:hypothetical protein